MSLIYQHAKPGEKSRFSSDWKPGFVMRFANGWSISVKWTTGSFCDRRSLVGTDDLWLDDAKPSIAESANAEIAITSENGQSYVFEDTNVVMGYQSTEQVLEWMNRISAW